jgi:hypothetical protein
LVINSSINWLCVRKFTKKKLCKYFAKNVIQKVIQTKLKKSSFIAVGDGSTAIILFFEKTNM